MSVFILFVLFSVEVVNWLLELYGFLEVFGLVFGIGL